MFLTRRTLVFLLGLLLCSHALGQSCTSKRYQERIFNSVDVSTDIIYGNAPALTTFYLGENFTVNIDLELDLFEPNGDTLSKRPLVILAFGGGFLIGSKEDEDIQATCDSLARLGYVTASINYRLGMNILSTSSAERAVYRAVQDFSAAVRFFKEFAGTYRIDTNYIFVGGVSAGSIAALQMAFGEESDRPASTYTNPDLGCADCSGNSYNHSSTNVKALVNCWGAMGDVNWIEPGEDVPIISFHGDQDLIVPYDSGYPFVALASMPYVYGSLPISQRADTVGLYNEFYTFAGVGHNVWGTIINNSFSGGPTVYFRPILHSISDFLFRFIKPDTGPITGDTAACLWDTLTYSVANTANATYCWTVNGGSIVSADTLNSSIDVSWEVAGANGLSVVEGNTFLATGDTQTYFVQVYAPPTASAGTDTIICEGSTHTLSGTIGGSATALLWTSAGDGTFDDSSLAAATYTPGPSDIGAGTVTLSITSDDPTGLCGAATDDMTLTINTLATVTAGADDASCEGDAYTLAGSFGGGTASILWTSDGDGTFDDSTLEAATYTPGPLDIAAGTVTLAITSDDPLGPCDAASDTMTLAINALATVTAGADDVICEGSTHTLSGTIGGSATAQLWTSSGDGAFDNSSQAATTYSPGPLDIAAGTTTLTITTDDPAGPCSAASDAMTLTINALATVTAGADDAVCEGDGYTLAGSLGGGAASILWTSDGDGSFDDTLLEAATYTPGPLDIATGTITLSVTTDDPAGPCGITSDTMTLAINALATVTAGADDVICEGSTYTLSGVIGGSATTLLWTSTGDGTFDDASLETATYTPGPLDIAGGTIALNITTNDPDGTGPCNIASDTMTLAIDPVPIVSAESDLSMCSGDTVTISGSGATTYQWSPTSGMEDPMAGTTNAYPVTTTAYTLSGTDATGCTGQDTLTITVFGLPSAIIQEVNDTLITSQGLVYQWYLNDTVLSGETAYFLATLVSGDYTVQVTDSNSCQSLSAPYSYSHISIPTLNGHNAFSIYPNPNSGSFKIKIPEEHKYGIQEIIITDVLGRQVYRKRLNENNSYIYQHSLNVNFLPTGTYIAVINIGTKKVFRKVIIH